MSRVAIIGCGNIGYRHLQALASVDSITELWIVEPNDARRAECVDGSLRPKTAATVQGVSSIDALPSAEPFALVVSAVTADVQPRLAPRLAKLPAKTLLLEKPIGQSIADLDAISGALGGRTTYVNCVRGLWSGYQRLRERLRSARVPVRIEVSGNAWGFGCNAVHFIELFAFLTSCKELRSVSAGLEPSPTGNKRGASFEEWVGTASFTNELGDSLQVTSGHADTTVTPSVITVRKLQGGALIACVNEPTDLLVTTNDDGSVTGGPLGLLHVSTSTATFHSWLQGGGGGDLVPTLADSRRSHEALFGCLARATGKSTFRIT